jgi:soluble cytochrome b562
MIANINLKLENQQSEFQKIGYEFKCFTNSFNQLVGELNRISTRAKIGKVQISKFSFQNKIEVAKYFDKKLKSCIELIEYKKDVKIQAKAVKEKALSNIKVGDMFQASWGYEQTNNNFYVLVKKITKTKAIFQEVGYSEIKVTSWCSNQVVINKASKIGREFQATLTGNAFNVSSCIRPYKFEDSSRDFHNSWGY